jgi:SNF2 family DNA or RNA helicase
MATLPDQAASEVAAGPNPEGRLQAATAKPSIGVNWLLVNYYNKRSCILADEMGCKLKTAEDRSSLLVSLNHEFFSSCFLIQLQLLPNTPVRGPFLVVAPLSLIGQ